VLSEHSASWNDAPAGDLGVSKLRQLGAGGAHHSLIGRQLAEMAHEAPKGSEVSKKQYPAQSPNRTLK